MKKLLGIVILSLLLSVSSKAEDKIDQLFGIKLNTDISMYANVEEGKISENMSMNETIYTFANDTLKNIERDPLFTSYNVRTDKNYKIKVVNAGKRYSFENEKFSDKNCNDDKFNFIKILTDELNLNSSKFKSFYRKNVDKKLKFDQLWSDTNYVYKDDTDQYRLMIICDFIGYQNKPYSRLYVSWMTEEYYRKNVIQRFEIIDEFNTDFILEYLVK
tara:strand:- start:62 stop:712 length:651 start_codon:yes stop_codon:yes gene_type:complete